MSETLQAPTSPARPPSAPPDAGASLLARLAHGLPTLVVLACLAALAWWGHHTGWSMPRFAALTGASTAVDDWCGEHAVPETVCVECNPGLLPRDKEYGWCLVHGIPNCPFEHPEVAQLPYPPPISTADLERARRALAFAPRPENNSRCKLHHRRLQFASQAAFDRAGIDVAPVWEEPVVESVRAAGEITYDQTRVARLAPRAAGAVWRVEKQVGAAVRQGDVLCLIDSAEVGRAKAELIQAATHFRLRDATYQSLQRASASIAAQRIIEAAAARDEAHVRLLAARQALVNLGLPVDADALKGLSATELADRVRFLGLPATLQRTLDPHTTTANLLPVRSPLDGVVVAREAVAGEVVSSTRTLFVVADVGQMWLNLGLRLEDAQRVTAGQAVRFRPDSGDEEVGGAVAWISTAADERTRTVRVRADLPNPHGRLRAGTFGRGQVILRTEPKALIVPGDAVHWEGDCWVVFVRDRDFLRDGAPKVFHVRKVRVGVQDGGNTEIIAGVLPGEVVATRGSGTLRAELLKNNLGEG